MLQLYLRSSSR